MDERFGKKKIKLEIKDKCFIPFTIDSTACGTFSSCVRFFVSL